MTPIVIGAQAVVLIGMIGLSIWGGRSIRADLRIPVRISSTGVEATVSKSTALVLWPILGGVVFFGSLLSSEDGEVDDSMAALGLALVAVLFLLQSAMLRRAARS